MDEDLRQLERVAKSGLEVDEMRYFNALIRNALFGQALILAIRSKNAETRKLTNNENIWQNALHEIESIGDFILITSRPLAPGHPGSVVQGWLFQVVPGEYSTELYYSTTPNYATRPGGGSMFMNEVAAIRIIDKNDIGDYA